MRIFVLLLLLSAIAFGAGCSEQATAPATMQTAMTTAPVEVSGAPSGSPATPAPAATAAPVPFAGTFIDSHAHIRPGAMTYDEILRLMDENGIDRMVVMEPPGDRWISSTPSSAYGIPEAAERFPDRFTVLYSGDALPLLYAAAKNGKYTQEQEEKFSTLLDEALASGRYRGIGEIGLRHLPPPGMPASYDITVPADHPWMFIMSDTAARYGVPLDIHLQAGDCDISAVERLLDHNTKTVILWDHAGDHTQNMNPDALRLLLDRHANLYSSIKIRTGERQSQGGILNKDTGNISGKWKALITDYSDRFVIGTDVKLGIRPDEIRFVTDHTSLLSQLPPETAQKVAQENPKRIFRI